MIIDAKPNVHAPRLNPFVLPSDTDFRFVLLIFAILSASIFIYSSLYFFVPANADSSNAANRAYADRDHRYLSAPYP